ncbi:MAG: hypothetical protein V4677_10645 [Bacteroidota bacterium]
MKTKQTSICNSVRGKVNSISLILTNTKSLSFVLLLLTLSMSSQPFHTSYKSSGVSVYGQISANGYGSLRMPALFYKNSCHTYFVGLSIQKSRTVVSGIQFNYNYSVTGLTTPGGENVPELYFYMSSAYNFNTKLGKENLRNEYMANPSATDNNVSSLRFQSAEIFVGAGLRLSFLKRFSWDNSIGFGGNYSFNFPEKLKLYYRKTNSGLQLRTGISYSLFSNY